MGVPVCSIIGVLVAVVGQPLDRHAILDVHIKHKVPLLAVVHLAADLHAAALGIAVLAGHNIAYAVPLSPAHGRGQVYFWLKTCICLVQVPSSRRSHIMLQHMKGPTSWMPRLSALA